MRYIMIALFLLSEIVCAADVSEQQSMDAMRITVLFERAPALALPIILHLKEEGYSGGDELLAKYRDMKIDNQYFTKDPEKFQKWLMNARGRGDIALILKNSPIIDNDEQKKVDLEYIDFIIKNKKYDYSNSASVLVTHLANQGVDEADQAFVDMKNLVDRDFTHYSPYLNPIENRVFKYGNESQESFQKRLDDAYRQWPNEIIAKYASDLTMARKSIATGIRQHKEMEEHNRRLAEERVNEKAEKARLTALREEEAKSNPERLNANFEIMAAVSNKLDQKYGWDSTMAINPDMANTTDLISFNYLVSLPYQSFVSADRIQSIVIAISTITKQELRNNFIDPESEGINIRCRFFMTKPDGKEIYKLGKSHWSYRFDQPFFNPSWWEWTDGE